MKLSPKSSTPKRFDCEVLAVGAHPDDVEFGCGAVIAAATQAGGKARLIVCSRGESGSRGTPKVRTAEAAAGARALGATIEFLLLDGDSLLEHKPAHALALAALLRRYRPRVLLAPTPVENQHPDHCRLGRIARDAARLARYGGIAALKRRPPHAVEHVLFYAVTPEGAPEGERPLLIDVSSDSVQLAWRTAMAAHASQSAVRPYAELQLARATAWGLRAGCGSAIGLYSDAPLIFPTLAALPGAARRF